MFWNLFQLLEYASVLLLLLLCCRVVTNGMRGEGAKGVIGDVQWVESRVYQKTKNISDHFALLVCFVTMISKNCPKKLDHSDQN